MLPICNSKIFSYKLNIIQYSITFIVAWSPTGV